MMQFRFHAGNKVAHFIRQPAEQMAVINGAKAQAARLADPAAVPRARGGVRWDGVGTADERMVSANESKK